MWSFKRRCEINIKEDKRLDEDFFPWKMKKRKKIKILKKYIYKNKEHVTMPVMCIKKELS